jgi:hypothetical protein
MSSGSINFRGIGAGGDLAERQALRIGCKAVGGMDRLKRLPGECRLKADF